MEKKAQDGDQRASERTRHRIRIYFECDCSGIDRPFLNDRITYDKHGETLEKERSMNAAETIAREGGSLKNFQR